MADVLATANWLTNAHLIADVARLGYLDGHVLDATYGEGTFWKLWRPEVLVTNDRHKPADHSYDFRVFPWEWVRAFDSVVFDPPYKLSGAPSLGQFDYRYGIDRAMKVGERLDMILDGASDCGRVASRHLLVKCQDQVVSGKVCWQTSLLKERLEPAGWRLADRFDFIYTPRKQRSQTHARRNTSQLLVFSRG